MTGVISSLSSFRIIGLIPSGLAALSALSFEDHLDGEERAGCFA